MKLMKKIMGGNKKAVKSFFFFKNKKADIAITILVIGVIVLCATALFSFYAVDKDRKIKGGINSVYYLQEVYNLAESVKYSGKSLSSFYEDDNTKVEHKMEKAGNTDKEFGKFKIEKKFLDKNKKVWLNVTYEFKR